MKTIKILIPIHTMPDIQSVITIFFENILPILRTRINVTVLWLVYTPEKIDRTKLSYRDSIILDIHDYKNAAEVIKKENPDLIYAEESWSFIEFAFSSAAKFFDIPVFCMVFSDIVITKNLTKNMISNLRRFFQNSIPTDTDQNKTKFMKRGRFYIYKYLFLVRTMMVLKSARLLTLFGIWKFVFLDKVDPRFASETIQFLENDNLLKKQLDLGYKKLNLIVTGNPIYDTVFKNISNQTNIDKKNNVIRVLFAPSTLYEHGFWTRNQRDYTVKETIKQIMKNGKEMSLTVKIHPSSSVLSDYESLIHPINSSIPIYHKGGIQDFLKDTDVMITFHSSTATTYALLAKKPIIICNFFHIKGDVLLERSLAIDCRDPSSITSSIDLALSSEPTSERKYADFIREFMYKWDGRAAERICDKIIPLMNKRIAD